MKKRMVVGISLVFMICIGLAETRAADIPITPAGHMLQSGLKIINSGDMDAIRRFVSDSVTSSFKRLFGEEDLFQVFYGFYEKYQGLDFYRATESSEMRITAVHRCSRTGSGYLFGLAVTDKKPCQIRGMTILPLADVEESGERVRTDEEIRSRVDEFVGKLADADVFSG